MYDTMQLYSSCWFYSEAEIKYDISLFFQAFSYVGFVVAVLWIYSTANEIVNILQVWNSSMQ